jgi:hypothetical protein
MEKGKAKLRGWDLMKPQTSLIMKTMFYRMLMGIITLRNLRETIMKALKTRIRYRLSGTKIISMSRPTMKLEAGIPAGKALHL